MSAPKGGRRAHIGRWVGGSALVLVVLGLGILLAARLARQKLSDTLPMPGRMVDIGGTRLHLNCVGQGEPTVILESGLVEFSLYWKDVMQGLSGTTRVCAYDRAGLGWSETAAEPRTVGVLVEELHRLVDAGGIRTPFVLVGHSFGGLLARAYSWQYPEQVAGLVLVDAAPEEFDLHVPTLKAAVDDMAGQLELLARLEQWGLLALIAKAIPPLGLAPAEADQLRVLVATRPMFRGGAAEMRQYLPNLAAMRDAKPGTPPGIPCAVLRRGLDYPMPGLSPEENAVVEARWREMQEAMASACGAERPVIAERSGHNIQLEQPELVIEAVKALVGQRPLRQGPKG